MLELPMFGHIVVEGVFVDGDVVGDGVAVVAVRFAELDAGVDAVPAA